MNSGSQTQDLTTVPTEEWVAIQEQLQLLSRQLPREKPLKISDPEPFHGSKEKLSNFLAQCQLKFLNHPQFREDLPKILYAISFLKGQAFSWIEPQLQEGQPNFQNWNEFRKALEASFGDPDPVETARIRLYNL